MRPQKVNDQELLDKITFVFRNKGYEGTSLNDLALACDLKKASLYHRFPQGKKQMANAVINHKGQWIKEYVISILENQTLLPSERLTLTIESIKSLYDNGNETCILRAFSMDNGLELFQSMLKYAVDAWINAFTKLGIDFGFDAEIAKSKATETIVKIQGSLVVSNIQNDTSYFINEVNSFKKLYQL